MAIGKTLTLICLAVSLAMGALAHAEEAIGCTPGSCGPNEVCEKGDWGPIYVCVPKEAADPAPSLASAPPRVSCQDYCTEDYCSKDGWGYQVCVRQCLARCPSRANTLLDQGISNCGPNGCGLDAHCAPPNWAHFCYRCVPNGGPDPGCGD